MKIETILNAAIAGVADMYLAHSLRNDAVYRRKERQVNAFRARILREFRAKEIHIKLLYEAEELLDTRIAEKVELIKVLDTQYVVLSDALATKDARIAELEAGIDRALEIIADD